MSRISDRVKQVKDLETEVVPVPQWGVDVEVRGMDGRHRAEFIRRITEAQESDDELAMSDVELDLIILSAFDPEDGSQVFEHEDKDWLIEKSGAVIGTLSQVAMRVSGLDSKAEERAGKDSSSTTLTAVSSSTSPSN